MCSARFQLGLLLGLQVLHDRDASERKRRDHPDALAREADVLRALRGTLDAVHLEGIFEDEWHVHFIFDLCSGMDLRHVAEHEHQDEHMVAFLCLFCVYSGMFLFLFGGGGEIYVCSRCGRWWSENGLFAAYLLLHIGYM